MTTMKKAAGAAGFVFLLVGHLSTAQEATPTPKDGGMMGGSMGGMMGGMKGNSDESA